MILQRRWWSNSLYCTTIIILILVILGKRETMRKTKDEENHCICKRCDQVYLISESCPKASAAFLLWYYSDLWFYSLVLNRISVILCRGLILLYKKYTFTTKEQKRESEREIKIDFFNKFRFLFINSFFSKLHIHFSVFFNLQHFLLYKIFCCAKTAGLTECKYICIYQLYIHIYEEAQKSGWPDNTNKKEGKKKS